MRRSVTSTRGVTGLSQINARPHGTRRSTPSVATGCFDDASIATKAYELGDAAGEAATGDPATGEPATGDPAIGDATGDPAGVPAPATAVAVAAAVGVVAGAAVVGAGVGVLSLLSPPQAASNAALSARTAKTDVHLRPRRNRPPSVVGFDTDPLRPSLPIPTPEPRPHGAPPSGSHDCTHHIRRAAPALGCGRTC
jgi:hypothetical protein